MLLLFRVTTGPSGDIWLGLVERSQKFLWQSTGENVTTGNWISDDLGTSVMPVDSAVVMNGTSNWAWQVVSRSAVAGVICQRGGFNQFKCEGEKNSF